MKTISLFLTLLFQLNLHAQTCNESPATDMSWTAISDEITSGKIKSIEELLCFLPQGLRLGYSLATESRSLQTSNSLNPRVMLFDNADPTRLLMTFNGESSQRGYRNLEVIRRTNKKSGEIEFFEVSFSADGNEIATIEKNPAKCLNCHGTRISGMDSRLLFDANPAWRGFYGSGSISRSIENLGLDEEKNFNAFKEHAKSHPRYRHLHGLSEKVPNRQNLPKGESPARVLENINKRLTMHFAHFNRYRMARLVMASSQYEKYKYSLFGALKCKEPVESFLPAKLREWHDNDLWMVDELKGVSLVSISEEQKKKITERLESENGPIKAPENLLESVVLAAKNNPLQENSLKFQVDGRIRQGEFDRDSGVTARWRYLLEGRREPVSMKEWNIDIDTGFYRFNNSRRDHSGLLIMARVLKEMDSEIAAADQLSCSELVQLSNERLQSFIKELETRTNSSERENKLNLLNGKDLVANSCAHCHQRLKQRHAPKIDFTKRLSISAHRRKICKLMSKPLRDRRHMPMLAKLEKSQIDTLFMYFKSINKRFRCRGWEPPVEK